MRQESWFSHSEHYFSLFLYLKEINEIMKTHTTPNKIKEKYDHLLDFPHPTKTLISPGCILT
jgi:hypothetical protein